MTFPQTPTLFTAALIALGAASPSFALPAAPPALTQTDQDPRLDEAVDALRRGDMITARRLVDALYVDERERTALRLLREGDGLGALDAIDQALELELVGRERRAAMLMVRGRAAYAAASASTRYASLFEEALETFERAAQEGAGVSAALRASRAARMLGLNQQALDDARAAVIWIDNVPGRSAGLDVDQPFARTWGEAAFSCYVEHRQATDGAPGSLQTRANLFNETRRAIERSIGESPTSPWGYEQLANLFLWEQRGPEALQTLRTGLAILPDNEGIHTAFVRQLGDLSQAQATDAGASPAEALQARYDAILGAYATFRERHPENALGFWYSAFETFYLALGKFETSSDVRGAGSAEFREAERLFEVCREREPGFTDACVDYEILCRTALGWCLYQLEEDEDAERMFFSAEDLRPLGSEAARRGRAAGLDLYLSGSDGSKRLPSALAGLDFLVRRATADPTSLSGLERGARLADRMFSARPENPNLANNVGFVNRDAAVLREMDATARFARAESDEDRAAAAASRARAQELIERSWAAYCIAAAMTPDDVRVVNDTGLIMTYYLRTDAEAAERYLLDAVADGTVQIQADMDEKERYALNEAWGDAHQNMGILEMTLRDNPAPARDWFLKALEIGPPSREWLRTDVLPRLEEWIETGVRPASLDEIEARTIWAHRP